jgi:hypothetical protein
LTADHLLQTVELSAAGLGAHQLDGRLDNVSINVAAHRGEIACLKGM